MDRMPLFAVALQSVPESVIILCLGLASIGVHPDIRKVLPAAVISALVSWGIRDLPIPFGLHSLLGFAVIFGLLLLIFRVEPLKALVAALFAVSSLLATEAVLLPAVTKLAGIAGFQAAWDDPVQRVVLAWPEQVLLGGAAFLLVRFKISFETLAQKANRQTSKEHFHR
ncbi:MAG: hypothetical protein ACYC2T_11660 [Bacillota bacterium]